MKQGEIIDGYEILHSIRLNAVTNVVAQNVASEDERYRIYKIGSANALGLADCETTHENHDYLSVMREYVRQLGAGLDVLGLDRMNRTLPHMDDALIKAGDCFPSDKLNLEGQVIAVKAINLSPEYRVASHQLYIATGGFGCSPESRGRAVYCKNIYDGGNDVRFDRENILGVVKPESIPAWAKEKVAKLQADKPSVLDEIKQSKQEARERPAKPKDAPARKNSEPDL